MPNEKNQLFSFKPLLLSVVFFLAIRPVRLWIGEPYAISLLTLALGVVSYWIPPRPHMSYFKWTMWSLRVAAIVFIAMTVWVLVFKRSTGPVEKMPQGSAAVFAKTNRLLPGS